MNVQHIDIRSPLLAAIKALGRSNSSTLGFFPDGAFDEYAKKKQILVAVDETNSLLGYLLYRISSQRVIIVHLCIDESKRRIGLAKLLLCHLREVGKNFKGIGLSCRRDFEASKIWPRLGLEARYERPGRSKAGSTLTFWWIDSDQPNLFSTNIDSAITGARPLAVLDANVFFDLEDNEDPDSNESKSLLADWLHDSVTLCLTGEIYNEIDRNDDEETRKRWKSTANTFLVLSGTLEEVYRLSDRLAEILPSPSKESDESDVRQLAHAIATEAEFFVTRDSMLLSFATQIQTKFGIIVVRPSELVIHIDELVRDAEYDPVRIGGSLAEIRAISKGSLPHFLTKFQNHEEHERSTDLVRKVRRWISRPDEYRGFNITNSDKEVVGLLVVSGKLPQVLEIPLFRTVKGRMANTLSKYLVYHIIGKAAREGRSLTRITDQFLSAETASSLEKLGFLKNGRNWIKVSIDGIKGIREITEEVKTLCLSFPDESLVLNSIRSSLENNASNESELLHIELSLWPVQIRESNLPCYIIPIRARWAMHLFEERIAEQTLFGSDPELALNSENVYYRSQKPNLPTAPSRVLWYVSSDDKFSDTKSINACSVVREVAVGKPKDLYRRFRRLGVYDWSDLLKLVDGDLEEEILAFRFSHTKLLRRPVGWDRLQGVLQDVFGHGSQLQSPVKIPLDCFEQICNLGQD